MLNIAVPALLGLAIASAEIAEPRQLGAHIVTIAGYVPGSDVRQHNRIDLDQQELEAYLGETPPAFTKAKGVYEKGAYSGAYASVTVAATSAALAKTAAVVQVGNAAATGTIKKDKAKGVTSVDISYTSTCIDNVHSKGNNIAGCFNSVGALHVGDPKVDIGAPSVVANKYRTLAGFSTKAGSKMATWATFKKFKAYYTNDDYAHRYVLDAFAGSGVFAGKDEKARIQGVKKGTAYMNVWMYTIHEMEDAIADCKAGCQNCNDDPVHAWDEAVAFYTGSLEGVDGSGKGYLLYNLADKRCENFMTCTASGDKTSGTSQVNIEIFKLFKQGLTKLTNGECAAVRPITDQIISLMTVPLIQGSLRYAYKVDKLQGGSKEKAEGAVFAAAVLPMVHACSATAAKTISDDLKIDTTTPMGNGFAKVKTAFESVYSCLGIKCAHVGGLILSGTEFHPGAAPCKDPATQASDSKGSSMFFAFTVISYIIMFATQ